MFSRLYSALAVIAVGTLLAGGGAAAFLLASGRLTPARIERMAAVLRGELDEWPSTQPAGRTAADSAGTAAGTAAGGVAAGGAGATAARGAANPSAASGEPLRSTAELRGLREREQLRRAALERAARDVQARQELLDQALHKLITMQEQFERAKAAWEQQRRKLLDTDKDAGFQRELEYVQSLTPRLAKEHLVRTWRKHRIDAVRLLNAMEPGKGRNVLEQFKTPEELDILHELLEELRTQEAAAASDAQPPAAQPPSQKP